MPDGKQTARTVKRTCFVSLACGALLVVVGAWFWSADNEPLPAPRLMVSALRLSALHVQDRLLERWQIRDPQLGDIDFDVSRPMAEGHKPVVTIVGGRRSDERLLATLGAPGDNVVVIYHWPSAIRNAHGLRVWLKGASLVRTINLVPAQIATMQHWLATQAFADSARLSLLGFSLGAQAVPAAEELAQRMAAPSAWLILAYGGAPLAALIESDPRLGPSWLRGLLAPWLARRFAACEPLLHLPHLRGQFLVLEGSGDHLVSLTARDNLWRAVPEPKQRIVLEGNHIGLGRERAALLQAIVAASGAWLAAQGAIHAMPSS